MLYSGKKSIDNAENVSKQDFLMDVTDDKAAKNIYDNIHNISRSNLCIVQENNNLIQVEPL